MYDRFEGNCTTSTLDPGGVDAKPDGLFVKMRDPAAFFDFDSIDFQYIGQVCLMFASSIWVFVNSTIQ
jgi:hypothetical protein